MESARGPANFLTSPLLALLLKLLIVGIIPGCIRLDCDVGPVMVKRNGSNRRKELAPSLKEIRHHRRQTWCPLFGLFARTFHAGVDHLAFQLVREQGVEMISLALMSALPLGVLKGTTPFSVVATAGLCIAMLPLGFRVLRDGPKPALRTALAWFLLTAALISLFVFVGEQG